MRDLATTVGFVLALAANTASAGTVTYTVSKPAATLPTTTIVDLPQFDRAIGRLDHVLISVRVNLQGTFRYENTSPSALPLATPNCSGFLYPRAGLAAGGGSTAWYVYNDADAPVCLPPLAGYDGLFDFAGTSGASIPFGPQYGNETRNGLDGSGSNAPPCLDAFSGYATTPISVAVDASHNLTQLPLGEIDIPAVALVAATVTYTYTAYPAEICRPWALFGGPPSCPCGVPTGSACPNSLGSAGAALTSSSTPSVSSPNFALQVSGVAPGAPCMFVQGSSSTNSGIPFGDGRMCVSGNIVRLGLKFAANGTASFPEFGIDPPLTVAGQIPGPGAYTSYQVWYRDSAPFCTPATFNMSSGIAATWNP